MVNTLLTWQLREIYSVVKVAIQKDVSFEQVMLERIMKQLLQNEPRQIETSVPEIAASPNTFKAVRSNTVDSNSPRIVVVGAGLAGLTCAYRLNQFGYHVKVYEASDRVGGRCWTRRGDFAENQIVERGGEVINSDHSAILQLAHELGFIMDDLLMSEKAGMNPIFYFNGTQYSYLEVAQDLKKIWRKLHKDVKEAGYPCVYNNYTPKGWELDHMSIVDWINKNVPNGIKSRFGQLLDVAYSSEFGAESSDQSSLNLLYLLINSFDLADERYRIQGGNDQLATRLAEILVDCTIFNSKLIALKQNNNGSFSLTFENGLDTKEVTADKLVLALPFSMLRTVDYNKACFRQLKKTAIEELGMGTNTKLHVQFIDRHWEKLGCNGLTYSDTGYQNTYEVSRAQTGASGILVSYSGGVIGASFNTGTPAEHAKKLVKDQLEPVLAGISSKWNGKSTIDYWTDYKWTRGSNSYWKVGQYTKFAGIEGEREGNCHFAGEHTSYDYQGYMNGAVESGERVAKEIHSDL